MSRAVELGRAVIGSQATNLELWLTTIITISSTTNGHNLSQLSSNQLLDLLQSGHVWICRGNGLHVDLHLTRRGEAFPQDQLQIVSDDILCAPIWDQLLLQPTPTHLPQTESDTIRLVINHTIEAAPQDVKQCHRQSSDIPISATQPPEGVQVIRFQSVRHLMDVIESRSPIKQARKRHQAEIDSNLKPRRRQKRARISNDHFSCIGSPKNSSPHGQGAQVHELVDSPLGYDHESFVEEVTPSVFACFDGGKEISESLDSDLTLLNSDLSPTIPSLDEVKTLIDGALRLSIYGNTIGRSSRGMKVKANTFHSGLADIAPALWRPNYLTELARRSQLIDTLSRSMNAIVHSQQIPTALKQKVDMLHHQSSEEKALGKCSPKSAPTKQSQNSTALIANRLWSHLQSNLTNKTGPSPQAFIGLADDAKTRGQIDEILEELPGDFELLQSEDEYVLFEAC